MLKKYLNAGGKGSGREKFVFCIQGTHHQGVQTKNGCYIMTVTQGSSGHCGSPKENFQSSELGFDFWLSFDIQIGMYCLGKVYLAEGTYTCAAA